MNIQVIERDTIEALSFVMIDGKQHSLGVHKDFRKNNFLRHFLPDNCRLSIAWVSLKEGEVLETHEHPIETMIIMCRGTGKMRGDRELDIKEGDIVTIPRGSKHGFMGTGPDGYWALTIQLEQRGLYENPDEALAHFTSGFQHFIDQNNTYMKAHVQNPLFELVLSDEIADKKIRHRLLDCIQVWSNVFQNVVMSRVAFTSDSRFKPLAVEHLLEEFGHNKALEDSRQGGLQKIWDPILQATSEWFAFKMQSYSDIERLVLVHLVLEGGAKVFHNMADPIMQSYHETKHFEVHNLADDGHLEMGLDLLRNLPDATYARLEEVLHEGWGMLNALCARMAELSRTPTAVS